VQIAGVAVTKGRAKPGLLYRDKPSG